LWLFNRAVTLNDLKRNVKNLDINIDAKNYRDFEAFNENNIKFELKAWDELRKQSRYLFFADDATVGKEVQLKLHFYIATVDKKKTTIDDDARVTLTFTVPQPVAVTSATVSKNKAQASTEEISLTERAVGGNRELTPVEQAMEDKEAESRKLEQTQAAELAQRTDELNLFITVKNKEITLIVNEIETMPGVLNRKDKAKKIDSLELVVNELKKRVDLYDKGYTDILLKQETIQNKFTSFATDHTIAMKLLNEKREQLDAYKKWLMPVVGGFSALMMGGMFLLQIISRIKAKKAQVQMMQKQLMANVPGMQQPPAKPAKEPPKKVREIDLIDINELDQI
jgi:hypothetical protein